MTRAETLPPSALPSVADIRGGDRGYLAYHAPRYRYLLALAARYAAPADGRILDIGLSPLTDLLRNRLGHPVDTLGLEAEPSAEDRRHFRFDLNALDDPAAPRPDLPRYAWIFLAEVIEHLHVSPATVFDFLGAHLAEGGRLVVQTPNAASLPKRLKLLAGRNPYDLIRDEPGNPGHFREYTWVELHAFAQRSGLAVVASDRRYYFDARFAHHAGAAPKPQPFLGALKNVVYRALPPALREGITLVLARRRETG